MATIMKVYDASRRHGYEEFVSTCESIQAFYGSGGGNVPLVVEIIDGDSNSRSKRTGYYIPD